MKAKDAVTDRLPAPTRPWEILLVEDNPAEARLTEIVFRDTGLPHNLRLARDGEQAIAMLRTQGPYAGLPQPDLVLLDLNLPRKDGREVLADVKNDPALAHIPIVVLSTSGAARDVMACYRLQANGYLQKPLGLEAFTAVLQSITRYWFRAPVLLPGKNSPRRDGH